MAYAGAKFAELVIRAAQGETGLVSPSFVALEADKSGGAEITKALGGKELEFFSARVQLGKSGVEKILPIGEVSAAEQKMIEVAVPELEGNIAKGVAFIKDAAEPKL
jgi:malate dehydrogenase